MKVYMKRNFAGYTGTSDDAVYYYNPKLKLCLMRQYVYPKLNHNNERTANVMSNLKKLNPSAGYRQDLCDYVMYYNDSKEYGHKPFVSWNNAWLRMMFALQKALPETVNLKTLTKTQIYDQNLPCKTVKDAINFGLLPAFPDYDRWNKEI